MSQKLFEPNLLAAITMIHLLIIQVLMKYVSWLSEIITGQPS